MNPPFATFDLPLILMNNATVQAEAVAEGVYRLPLPSETLPPFDHTNSYLIISRGVGVLVDAGSKEESSLEALEHLLQTTGVTLFKALLLTHTHPDHCVGAKRVQERFDTPIYVHPLERPRLEETLKLTEEVISLQDERVLTVGNKEVRAFHTPGHSPGHLSFYLPNTRTLLAGDVVASRGSTWVGVPEGDVSNYLATLERLQNLDATVIGPGHGEVILNPRERLQESRAHRLGREQQVLDTLGDEQLSLSELRTLIYPQVPEHMTKLVEGSVLAHLKKLMAEMKVVHLGVDEAGPYAVRR